MKSMYLHPKAKRTKRPEQLLQIGAMSHLTPLMILQKFEKFLIFAVPNGGFRTHAEAGIMKAMGQMPGVTDLVLCVKHSDTSECYHGRTVWIEIKCRSIVTVKGKKVEKITPTSDDQEKFRDRIKALGFDHRLVAATDISDCLNQILAIMREYGVS